MDDWDTHDYSGSTLRLLIDRHRGDGVAVNECPLTECRCKFGFSVEGGSNTRTESFERVISCPGHHLDCVGVFVDVDEDNLGKDVLAGVATGSLRDSGTRRT